MGDLMIFTNSPTHQFINLLRHLNEVANLVNHPARFGGVLQLDRMADPRETEALHDDPLAAIESGGAREERHLHGAAGPFRVRSMVRHGLTLPGPRVQPAPCRA